MTGTPPPLLELSQISLAFGGVQALSDIDLTLNNGEILAIIGPNGAGKSSLLNLISGIYGTEPQTACEYLRTRTRIPESPERGSSRAQPSRGDSPIPWDSTLP